jgi:hypothetical protein
MAGAIMVDRAALVPRTRCAKMEHFAQIDVRPPQRATRSQLR